MREAIFSALDARDALRGARVVDLYAGSGALGLEAASRGAAHVTLVDRSIATARRNASTVLGQAPRDAAPVVVSSAQSVQPFLVAAHETWDVAFLDPPYDLGEQELTRALEALVPRLGTDAIVVVERSARSPQPALPAGLELDRRKAYGETALYWLSATESS